MEQPIKLLKGNTLSCANWRIEGALRMLFNNIVQAADPKNLIVYGGRGKAARNRDCFYKIVDTLKSLKPDETMLIQSGKAVGVLKTYENAAKILICNAMLVGMYDNDECFWPLEESGLTMYGQMTAGSWAYIGQQGIMQGTYQTFVEAGAGPGKFLLSAGLGNMGGAQAPAGKMSGAATLIAEINPLKIERCKKEGWIDESYTDIKAAVKSALMARESKRAAALAVQANAVDVLSYIIQSGIVPDIVTDQTAAHDPLFGYFPDCLSFEESLALKERDAREYIGICKETMRRHVEMLIKLQSRGAEVFEYGNGIRFNAKDAGLKNAFEVEGFVTKYIRPLFCQGKGPFRVAALSGNQEDILAIDNILLELFGGNKMLCGWIRKAQKFIDFGKQPGLPARVCWLGQGERLLAVEKIWRAVRDKKISAPIWVGRDHLDSGTVASPGRETENMKDGSDAIADWPILSALAMVASGADWVSVHNGGGVGIGKAIHTGQCFVVTPEIECLKRAVRVFTNDPAIGLMRHADAGYESAIRASRAHGIKIPMLNAS